MNPRLGWALALVALAVGGAAYGWRGLALATSAVLFWLMLQLNRSVRVMRAAATAPLGQVPSAVMLQAKLRIGMPMLEIVAETRCLGRHLGSAPDLWGWSDAAGNLLQVALDRGRCTGWTLLRSDDRADDDVDHKADDRADDSAAQAADKTAVEAADARTAHRDRWADGRPGSRPDDPGGFGAGRTEASAAAAAARKPLSFPAASSSPHSP